MQRFRVEAGLLLQVPSDIDAAGTNVDSAGDDGGHDDGIVLVLVMVTVMVMLRVPKS